MRAHSGRLRVADGVFVRKDGTFSRIHNPAGIKHVMQRADVAMGVTGPSGYAGVRLDLLPRVIELPGAEHHLLGDGERIYVLWDRSPSGATLVYWIEVLAPHSPGRVHANVASLVDSCAVRGVSTSRAKLSVKDNVVLFHARWLAELVQEQRERDAAETAAHAEAQGAAADQVEGIAAGWPNGKVGLHWSDCAEPMQFGNWAAVYVAICEPDHSEAHAGGAH